MEEFFLDEFSELFMNFIRNHDCDWNYINMNIIMKDIEENPNLGCLIDPQGCLIGSQSWNYKYISRNPNLTIDFILKNLDKNFCWYYISMNKNIFMKDIEENISQSWDYQ